MSLSDKKKAFNGMSQVQRLGVWLKEYKEIDPLVAWKYLGIYRLGARIYDLRKKGWKIETHTKRIKNQFNEECKVALYRFLTPARQESPELLPGKSKDEPASNIKKLNNL